MMSSSPPSTSSSSSSWLLRRGSTTTRQQQQHHHQKPHRPPVVQQHPRRFLVVFVPVAMIMFLLAISSLLSSMKTTNDTAINLQTAIDWSSQPSLNTWTKTTTTAIDTKSSSSTSTSTINATNTSTTSIEKEEEEEYVFSFWKETAASASSTSTSPPWALFFNLYLPSSSSSQTTNNQNVVGIDDMVQRLEQLEEQIQIIATSYATTTTSPASPASTNTNSSTTTTTTISQSQSNQVVNMYYSTTGNIAFGNFFMKGLCQRRRQEQQQQGGSTTTTKNTQQLLSCIPLTKPSPKKKASTKTPPTTTNLNSKQQQLDQQQQQQQQDLVLQHLYDYCQIYPTHQVVYLHNFLPAIHPELMTHLQQQQQQQQQAGTTKKQNNKNQHQWETRIQQYNQWLLYWTYIITRPECFVSTTTTSSATTTTTMSSSSSSCHVCGSTIELFPFLRVQGNFFTAQCSYIQQLLPINIYRQQLTTLLQPLLPIATTATSTTPKELLPSPLLPLLPPPPFRFHKSPFSKLIKSSSSKQQQQQQHQSWSLRQVLYQSAHQQWITSHPSVELCHSSHDDDVQQIPMNNNKKKKGTNRNIGDDDDDQSWEIYWDKQNTRAKNQLPIPPSLDFIASSSSSSLQQKDNQQWTWKHFRPNTISHPMGRDINHNDDTNRKKSNIQYNKNHNHMIVCEFALLGGNLYKWMKLYNYSTIQQPINNKPSSSWIWNYYNISSWQHNENDENEWIQQLLLKHSTTKTMLQDKNQTFLNDTNSSSIEKMLWDLCSIQQPQQQQEEQQEKQQDTTGSGSIAANMTTTNTTVELIIAANVTTTNTAEELVNPGNGGTGNNTTTANADEHENKGSNNDSQPNESTGHSDINGEELANVKNNPEGIDDGGKKYDIDIGGHDNGGQLEESNQTISTREQQPAEKDVEEDVNNENGLENDPTHGDEPEEGKSISNETPVDGKKNKDHQDEIDNGNGSKTISVGEQLPDETNEHEAIDDDGKNREPVNDDANGDNLIEVGKPNDEHNGSMVGRIKFPTGDDSDDFETPRPIVKQQEKQQQQQQQQQQQLQYVEGKHVQDDNRDMEKKKYPTGDDSIDSKVGDGTIVAQQLIDGK